LSVRRVPALDGLRGLAIALVLCTHFVRAPDGVVGELVRRAAGSGWIGVDLFFVLSGYLITGILLDSRGDRLYFRSFYTRRALRILPLYYGLLAIILLLPRSSAGAEALGASYLSDHQPWFWTHTVNWLMVAEGTGQTAVQHGFGALWSLSIEEQFYLAWPLVCAVVSRRQLGWLAATAAAGSMLLRVVLSLRGVPDLVLYTATFTRLDPLAIGALLAVLAREGGFARFRTMFSWSVIATAAALVLFAAAAWGRPNANAVIFAGVAFAVALGWGAILIRTASGGGPWVRMMECGPLRALGKYSYALYLFQAPVDHLLTRSGAGPEAVSYPGYAVLGFGLTFAAAFASWHLWEKRWLRLKERTPRRSTEATAFSTPFPQWEGHPQFRGPLLAEPSTYFRRASRDPGQDLWHLRVRVPRCRLDTTHGSKLMLRSVADREIWGVYARSAAVIHERRLGPGPGRVCPDHRARRDRAHRDPHPVPERDRQRVQREQEPAE